MEMEFKEPALAYGQMQSLDLFLKFAETSELRYEYLNGELLVMTGNTKDHADITFNLNTQIKNKLKGRKCQSFQETIFLRIKKTNTLFLPDILVTCDPNDFDRESKFLDFPTLIIEVLSNSTEINDRNQKWQQYKQIPTLKHYLLVSQKNPLVEVYSRPNAQSLFYYQPFEGLDATVDLKEMDIQIRMSDIYEGIFSDEKA
jgi:Uma2 family endonuclease